MESPINYKPFYNSLCSCGLTKEADLLSKVLEQNGQHLAHGDLERWTETLSMLPSIKVSRVLFDRNEITLGSQSDCDHETGIKVKKLLKRLMPWRKGPYNILGILIDSEWRSDRKWERVVPHISPLKDRVVLDVGCGNGYHCWRMYGEEARLVTGIDPMPLFLAQFEAVKHFMPGKYPVHLLPLGIDDLPDGLSCFDTVFSMGVFYHRRSPFDHLIRLRELIKPGGELVLETLVIDGEKGKVLVPENRYAKMRNVWFIPSPLTMELWLERAGFNEIRTVDITRTTTDEQRKTEWMNFESLEDFLDPNNLNCTIEGHPAPVRAVFICRRH